MTHTLGSSKTAWTCDWISEYALASFFSCVAFSTGSGDLVSFGLGPFEAVSTSSEYVDSQALSSFRTSGGNSFKTGSGRGLESAAVGGAVAHAPIARNAEARIQRRRIAKIMGRFSQLKAELASATAQVSTADWPTRRLLPVRRPRAPRRGPGTHAHGNPSHGALGAHIPQIATHSADPRRKGDAGGRQHSHPRPRRAAAHARAQGARHGAGGARDSREPVGRVRRSPQ